MLVMANKIQKSEFLFCKEMDCKIIRAAGNARNGTVRDSSSVSCQELLFCFAARLIDRVDEVHLLNFDPITRSVRTSDIYDRLYKHDGSCDVYGWLDSSRLSVHTDLTDYMNKQFTQTGSGHKILILINSLSPILLQHGPAKTAQILNRLSRVKFKGAEVVQVIYLLHADLHDDTSLSLVRHVTTSILKMSPSTSPDHFAACQTIQKRQTGKVIKIVENFNIRSVMEVVDVQQVKPTITMATVKDDGQPDPTADLTFNLSLTEQEKQARSKLVLPYTLAIDRSSVTTNQDGGRGESGEIFYEPDEADDFDEEDPDDDLNI